MNPLSRWRDFGGDCSFKFVEDVACCPLRGTKNVSGRGKCGARRTYISNHGALRRRYHPAGRTS